MAEGVLTRSYKFKFSTEYALIVRFGLSQTHLLFFDGGVRFDIFGATDS